MTQAITSLRRLTGRASARVALAAAVLTLLTALPAQAQAYRDLPGVKTPADQATAPPDITCRTVEVEDDDPFEPTFGPRGGDLVYACRSGDGPEFRSTRLPPSLERQRRGLNW